MPEQLKQKISQLLDDELAPDQALGLLETLRSDLALQATYQRYEAISHALKTEVFLTADASFAAKIQQQIQQEPSYLLPQRKPKPQWRNHQTLAIAAAMALVAVLVGQSLTFMHESKLPTSAPPALAQQTPPPASPLQIAQQQAKAAADINQIPLNKRINEYLQAHNNSVYNQADTFQPYARVTTYSEK